MTYNTIIEINFHFETLTTICKRWKKIGDKSNHTSCPICHGTIYKQVIKDVNVSKDLSERLLFSCRVLDITVRDIAKEIKISERLIFMYKNGKVRIPLIIVKKILQIICNKFINKEKIG